MLLIAVAGFRPLKPLDVKGPNVFRRIDQLRKDLNREPIHVLKLHYKNIIYTNSPGHSFFGDETDTWGVKKTLENIHRIIIEDPDQKIIIIGYSLGGWGAAVLTHYLINGFDDGIDRVPPIAPSKNIEGLIQIDAYSITPDCPIINESNWADSVRANLSENNNNLLTLGGRNLNFPGSDKIIGWLFDSIQNLADDIDDNEIKNHYQLPCNQNLVNLASPHQVQLPEGRLKYRLNYFASDDIKEVDIFSRLAQIATTTDTGPLPPLPEGSSLLIQNTSIDANHLVIDDTPVIYTDIEKFSRFDYQYAEQIKGTIIESVIQKYAPVVIFHPKEGDHCSYPSDPAEYYENPETKYGYNSNSQFVEAGPKPPATTKSFAKIDGKYTPAISISENKRVAPKSFLDDGSAPCYVQCWKSERKLNDNLRTYIQIKYWFWNRYNDHPSDDLSGSALLKAISWGVQLGKKLLSIVFKRFKAKDHKHLWSHEGDWEHLEVRVTIDVNGNEVGRPLYYFSQHTWTDFTTKPRKEQCGGDAEMTHPIVYMALGSHATYKSPQRLAFLNLIDKVKANSKSLRWETCKSIMYHSEENVSSNVVYEFPGKWGGSPHPAESGHSPDGPANKDRFANQKIWQGEHQQKWPGLY